jgi:hypothetical protein
MLIDYSLRSFEVLERALTYEEKNEVFEVFTNVGRRMGVNGLPETFEAWLAMRQAHLAKNLKHSEYTDDLFQQYCKHLGPIRYRILLEAQTLVVPPAVREQLGFRRRSLLHPLILLYKLTKRLKMDWVLKELLLPKKYKKEIKALDKV